jgi:hypothetical protein
MQPDALASLIVDTIDTALAPLRVKQAALEAQLSALEALRQQLAALAGLGERVAGLEGKWPVPGPPGPPGADGKDGTDGLPGKDGVAGLTYRGVYTAGTAYARGDVVSWDGSAWHCQDGTTSRPGEAGSAATWTLMVKHGRDARGRP